MLVLIVAAGSGLMQAQSQPAPAQEEILHAMRGVWEIQSRHRAGGEILRPPEVNGLLVATKNYSVTLDPLSSQPDANRISAYQNEYGGSGLSARMVYSTHSANAASSNQGELPEVVGGTFSRALQEEEAGNYRRITGQDAAGIASADSIVQRREGMPVHVFSGDRLTVIGADYVDSYLRTKEDTDIANPYQKKMMGVWNIESRTLPGGQVLRPPDISGFMVCTQNYSVEMLPMVKNPESKLIFAARNNFEDANKSSQLFYLTRSAESATAPRVYTKFPSQDISFSRELTPEEVEWYESITGLSAADLFASDPDVFVERIPQTPTYVFTGNRLTLIDKSFVDVYVRIDEP